MNESAYIEQNCEGNGMIINLWRLSFTMYALIITVLILILIVFLLWLSYYLGYKKHLNLHGIKQYPKRSGELTLFIDGRELYTRYFADIRNAKKSLEIQFYTVCDDKICNEFLNILRQKAKEGLTVRLLLDYYGSKNVKKAGIKLCRDEGVKVAFSNKPRLPYLLFTSLTHNHRKISVIDGTIGYIGGFNLGEEYLGNNPKLGYWRDYHLKVQGKSVDDLRNQFYRDWNVATQEKQTYLPQENVTLTGGIEHHFEGTNGAHLQDIFLALVKHAKKELYICTPYFIPGKELTDELIKAIKRGVNVKILVPFQADYPLVKEAAFRYYGLLLPHGCKIYRFYQGFYHSKVIVVDDELCNIGSGNFNKRSFYLNDEMNGFFYTPSFINMVKESIEEDIRRSELLTYESYQKRPLLQKGREQVANLLSRFL
ncbi:cardiolipin synthase [Fictibacillus sp. KIGAM418]|uniref:Cardiolipin synthase n=1 Tax=Fictibacillus marinisediminis TaxID=2878389 RepID=A0A9X1XJQ4_9BACL|nr:cardiolipin synthase [Fictibacillus marinisediminis]MCK6258809.1 cardiolipin synthase [Fictibacillus marinisediminis]